MPQLGARENESAFCPIPGFDDEARQHGEETRKDGEPEEDRAAPGLPRPFPVLPLS